MRISGISLGLRTSLPQLQKGCAYKLLNLRVVSEDGSDVRREIGGYSIWIDIVCHVVFNDASSYNFKAIC